MEVMKSPGAGRRREDRGRAGGFLGRDRSPRRRRRRWNRNATCCTPSWTTLPHNIYFKDAASRFIRINKAMAAYFGLQRPRRGDRQDRLRLLHRRSTPCRPSPTSRRSFAAAGRSSTRKRRKPGPTATTTWALTTKMPLLRRAAADRRHLRHFPRHHRAETGRRGLAGGQGSGRGRQSRQERLPGQHEPRDPHALERRHRHDRTGAQEPALRASSASSSPRSATPARPCCRVINDILDFSKIEAGKLVLERAPFDLRESLGDTMKSFAIRAHQQGLGTGLPHPSRRAAPGRGRLSIGCGRSSSTWSATPSSSPSRRSGPGGRAANRCRGEEIAAALHRQRHGHRHPGGETDGRSSRCSSRPTARRPAGMAARAWGWPSPRAWSA